MADAMVKGITGFDYEKAFDAAKHSTMSGELVKAYKKMALFPLMTIMKAFLKLYAYDWCIAQMAQILNKKRIMSIS
jgi:putative alpha-1,2-mannosidase